MSLFGRMFGGMFSPEELPPAPGWAGFFSPQQFRTFMRGVETHFRKKKVPFTVEDGIVHVKTGEPDNVHHFGLQNLAQLCHQVDEQQWPEVIDGHFKTVERGWREQAALGERLHSFERVKDLLMVRLWPKEFLDGMDADRLIFREDLEGTVSVLVYDMPSAIQNVNAADAQAWDQNPDDLFDLGLENVYETCIPDRSVQPIDEEVDVVVLSDESFFVASHSLLLDRHEDCVGTHGSLVGIPHRHVLLCYPIENVNVVRAIHRMIPIIHGMEREGPGSISDRLYWYHDDGFSNLPYRIDDQTLQFYPPDDFMEMLNGLAEE